MIEFEEQDLGARAPLPEEGGKWDSVPLVRRTDPLTGHSCRILTGVKLQPESPPDLSGLLSRKGFCPFCEPVFDSVTYPFEPEVVPGGRIRRNAAAIVPNIMAYSSYSSVCVYDTGRHFLALEDFTQDLLYDAFSAVVDHARLLRAHRSDLVWSSISANYLPPSGSSVLHPHLQSSHDTVPMQYQRETVDGARRYYREFSSSYFEDLLSIEKRGPRFIGTSGALTWLTPFAPQGFQEIDAIFDAVSDVVDMGETELRDLSSGLSRVLQYYRSQNFSAFNFSMAGGGPAADDFGYRLVFRILVRSNSEPYYRSDVTYFERMLCEPLLDVAPELVASACSPFFG